MTPRQSSPPVFVDPVTVPGTWISSEANTVFVVPSVYVLVARRHAAASSVEQPQEAESGAPGLAPAGA